MRPSPLYRRAATGNLDRYSPRRHGHPFPLIVLAVYFNLASGVAHSYAENLRDVHPRVLPSSPSRHDVLVNAVRYRLCANRDSRGQAALGISCSIRGRDGLQVRRSFHASEIFSSFALCHGYTDGSEVNGLVCTTCSSVLNSPQIRRLPDAGHLRVRDWNPVYSHH